MLSPSNICSPSISPHSSPGSSPGQYCIYNTSNQSALLQEGSSAHGSSNGTRSDKKRKKASSAPSPSSSLSDEQQHQKQLAEFGPEIILSRETILSITVIEFDEYLQALQKNREITALEMKELRRQRRLIQNREYAHQRREKIKRVSQAQEQQFASLENENQKLKAQNALLTEEVIRLRALLAQQSPPSNPSIAEFEPAVSQSNSSASQFFSLFNSIQTPSLPDPHSTFSSPVRRELSFKATGACLFAIFFSYAFLFSPHDSPSSISDVPSVGSSRVLLDMSDSSLTFFSRHSLVISFCIFFLCLSLFAFYFFFSARPLKRKSL